MDSPTSHRSLAIVSLVAILLPIALTTPAVGNAATGSDLRPGGVIRLDGISIVVPGPGRGAWGAALDVRGRWRSLGVQTALDGSVHIVRTRMVGGHPSAPSSEAGPHGRSDPCTDGAYVLYSTKWSSRYLW